ncbi:hypothetical protein GGI07_004587 [Coemansia sp. Benny D115]|nr:hypothetical protein GGI07_004587 [Coemansia sp. Benny D115]
MADVMHVHGAIYDKAGILHRDISCNNVLFYRTNKHPYVRGLLIDFDHAVDCSDKQRNRRLDRSGTLPFMSINNLAGNFGWVSGLDDWESTLYLMCWIATYGFNSNQAPDEKVRAKLRIRAWCEGPLDRIVDSKRSSLSTKAFFDLIVREFLSKLSEIGLLKKLVRGLRSTLIDDTELDPEFRGTVALYDEDGEKLVSDPFFMRKKKEREFMKSLRSVLRQFSNEAMLLIE